MPLFISYSHQDRAFVDKLAARLVKKNAQVWVDRWELNVGDSILNRVQTAIEKASALLVVLSKAAAESEWCKKELSAGLIRELEEKRVLVLPVLLEDCQVPIFLREKKYADFRNDFDSGLNDVLSGAAAVINSNQGRLNDDDGHSDWAVDWGFNDGLFFMHFTVVHVPQSLPMTILTEVTLKCDATATRRYQQFCDAGLDWIGRTMLAEWLFEFGDQADRRIILSDQFPQKFEGGITDSKRGIKIGITAACRKMGLDNGKDQLVNISDILKGIRDNLRAVERKPNADEIAKIKTIVASPLPTT